MHWNWRTFALFLALVLTVWMWPSIFGGKVFLPLDILSHNPPHESTTAGPVHNALIGDMVYENFTWHDFQRQALARGELPLWNTYTFAGHPLYATGQASTFYPLNALFWIRGLPLARAYVVFIGLHLFLGGLFTYLFCRRMGVGGFGAAIGGTAFALGGFLTARLVFPMLLGSAIWLPLMLLWIDWMAEPRQLAKRTRGLLIGALLFVQPLLAGFIEIAFYAYIACGVFTLFRVAGLSWRTRVAPVFLLKVAVAPVMAALLAAPLLLPFLEVIHLNIRAGQGDYASMKASALAPEELLTTISPDALGNPAEHADFDLSTRRFEPAEPHYFGPKNYVEVGFYFGLLPLLFLLLSPARRGRGFVFAWTLVALAASLALVTPLYKVFYYCVPGAEQVRTPFRWLYLALFAGAFLAAIGGQHWHERLQRPAGRLGRWTARGLAAVGVLLALATVMLLLMPGPLMHWAQSLITAKTRIAAAYPDPAKLAGFLWVNGLRFALFTGGALLCVALAGWRAWSPRAAGWLSLVALAFVAFDLGQAGYGFYPHTDPKLLDTRPPIIEHMMADSGQFRFGRYGSGKYLYSNFSTLYGLQDFGGYDSIILKDYVTFLNAIENQHLVKYNIVMTIEQPRSLRSPLLPLLNLRYLLTSRTITHPDWEPVPVEGNIKLYRVRPERELPRAFLVANVHPVDTLDAAIQAIKAQAVDVFTAATVETSADKATALAEAAPGDAERGTASITDYGFSRVRIRASAPARRLLVLLDVYYPGWNTYIDGQRAAVYRADGVFRGVSVPAGEHTVEFRFEPFSFRLGVAISAACLLLLIVLAALGRRRSPAAVVPPYEPSVPPPDAAEQGGPAA